MEAIGCLKAVDFGMGIKNQVEFACVAAVCTVSFLNTNFGAQ